MPSFREIENDLSQYGVPEIIEFYKYLDAFAEKTKRNVIVYYSGWLDFPNANTAIDETDMSGFMNAVYKMDKTKGLDLVLHTPGGEVTATEAIGNYLKEVFGNDMHCYVPHMAMSCGTLLSMACKEIHMGHESSLGPIDPSLNGNSTHAVVEEFERAHADIDKNPNLALLWRPILEKYPIGFYGECKKGWELAGSVAEDWLKGGMFGKARNLTKKIDKILKAFNDHAESKIHSRHISARKAKSLGLTIKLFEEDPKMQDAVLSLHHSALLLLRRKRVSKMILSQLKQGVYRSCPLDDK